jgi:hypothetical protein
VPLRSDTMQRWNRLRLCQRWGATRPSLSSGPVAAE